VVNFFPQQVGASEGDYSTFVQHHIVSSGGISASSLFFVLDTKFTEPANQDILSVSQCTFDLFQQDFNQLSGSIFGKSEFIVDSIYNICFSQCH
jgi:hypothetical protein